MSEGAAQAGARRPQARVEIVPYDPAWPGRFEAERASLAAVLGPCLAGEIHHVGSTAVPGLAAKPVIDLMAGIADLESALPALAALERLGYRFAPYVPWMHWFCKPSEAVRTHHLHLVPVSHPQYAARLAFRDYLRRREDVAAAYERLKRDLAARFSDDREAYTQAKWAFIRDALAEAGVSQMLSVIVQDDHEPPPFGPLALWPGDRVRTDLAPHARWPAFTWVENRDGAGGWVPIRYLPSPLRSLTGPSRTLTSACASAGHRSLRRRSWPRHGPWPGAPGRCATCGAARHGHRPRCARIAPASPGSTWHRDLIPRVPLGALPSSGLGRLRRESAYPFYICWAARPSHADTRRNRQRPRGYGRTETGCAAGIGLP